MTMNSPHPSSEEIFHRLLDESSARLAAPESRGIVIPDDELHREIIVPLLPAMLADAAIRQHWNAQAATGFVARLARHFDGGESAPRWLPGDFEIHVTASYSASPDARALADTLLSEDSLRDLTAALMNQLLDAVWPALALASPEVEPAVEIAPPAEPIKAQEPAENFGIEALPTASIETPETPVIEAAAVASEPELPPDIRSRPQPIFSHALVRALCRKPAFSVVRRGLAANHANDATAAICARRILQRARRLRPAATGHRHATTAH